MNASGLIPPTVDDARTVDERESTVVYVCARDRALSGWAGVRNSTYVIACASKEEADIVESNLLARGDMTHVRFAMTPPRARGRGHHVKIVGRTAAPRYFTPNAWR